jgi:hypothetical protein
LIGPEQADLEWLARTRDRAPTTTETAEFKAREAASKAELRELQVQRLKDSLVDRAGVDESAKYIRQSLEQRLVEEFPAKLAPMIAQMPGDVDAVESLFRSEVRAALAAIVAEWSAVAEAEAAKTS